MALINNIINILLKMKKVTDLTAHEIEQDPFLNEFLAEGLINYSALARRLLPKIKKQNKEANVEAIIMAIRRYVKFVKKRDLNRVLKQIIGNLDIVILNNIEEITYSRTAAVLEKINKIAATSSLDLGKVVLIIQGIGEVTVITDKHTKRSFDKLKLKTKDKKENLGLICLIERDNKSIPKSIDISGFMKFIVDVLTMNNINIINFGGTHNQTFLVFEDEDLMKAYNVLDEMIKRCSS